MNCRLCGNKLENFQIIKNMPKNVSVLYEKPVVRHGIDTKLYHCNNCDLYQIEDLADNTYYDDYLMTASHSNKLNILQDNELKNILKYANNKNNFLEVGCGDGNFLLKANKFFKNVIGIEPSEKFYKLCISKKLNVKHMYLEANSNIEQKFDVIVSRQVFEHLNNPKEIFEKMVNLLDDNGIIFLDVPNGGKSIRENRYFDIFSDHVNHWTVKSLTYLAEINGLTVVDIREGFDGDYLELYCKKTKVEVGGICAVVNKEQGTLIDILNSNDKVGIWGAGAKAYVLFNVFSNDLKSVKSIIDSDKFKIGKYIPNAVVPITAPDISKINELDAIIIFAKSYSDEITYDLREKYQYKGKIFSI